MSNKRELLLGLLSGEITPGEFKEGATAPNFIHMVAFSSNSKKRGLQPKSKVNVTIDGKNREMTYSEYLDLVKKYPGASTANPIVFEEPKPISLK